MGTVTIYCGSSPGLMLHTACPICPASVHISSAEVILALTPEMRNEIGGRERLLPFATQAICPAVRPPARHSADAAAKVGLHFAEERVAAELYKRKCKVILPATTTTAFSGHVPSHGSPEDTS